MIRRGEAGGLVMAPGMRLRHGRFEEIAPRADRFAGGEPVHGYVLDVAAVRERFRPR